MSDPSRRNFLASGCSLTGALWIPSLLPRYAYASEGIVGGAERTEGPVLLDIAESRPLIDGRVGRATTVNGTMPGPLIRLVEGQEADLRVTNSLREDSSIHWHGLILPAKMDGVPGVSFAGIPPGETFNYRFNVGQSGTYWYHSHSGLQEQTGVFGPIIIDPKQPERFEVDREHVVMLSDWSFRHPMRILAMLKKSGGMYNFQRRTVADVLGKKDGMTLQDSARWGRMRMDPTDIADVTGVRYTYLMNGVAPDDNWTGLFQPGERVRLRFINAAAMTYFDLRIPGLEMTVVAVDGQAIVPVTVDEFRIAVAETYDVIVRPKSEGAYTIFAETMDRSGFARGTLASTDGMVAEVPERRRRAVRTMADMGMDMSEMEMDGSMDMSGADEQAPMDGSMDMPGAGEQAPMDGSMDMSGSGEASQMDGSIDMSGAGEQAPMDGSMDMTAEATEAEEEVAHGEMPAAAEDHPMSMDMTQPEPTAMTPPPEHRRHGPGATGFAKNPVSRLHERGIGLDEAPWRVLTYADLSAPAPFEDQRPPSRDLELHLTGNMERYMWSFDGKKYSEVDGPIVFTLGERLRLILVNDTMMEHPIHLHGMWMELEGTRGAHPPRKHTINVKPGERLTALISADAPGDWAFHCHLLYHMDMGMFRVVSVRAPGVMGRG